MAQQIPAVGISSTASIGQPTVSLAVQEKVFGPFVARTLDEHIRQGEHDLRERIAKKTLRIFLRANLSHAGSTSRPVDSVTHHITHFRFRGLLGAVFVVDTALLASGLQNADQRLIELRRDQGSDRGDRGGSGRPYGDHRQLAFPETRRLTHGISHQTAILTLPASRPASCRHGRGVLRRGCRAGCSWGGRWGHHRFRAAGGRGVPGRAVR